MTDLHDDKILILDFGSQYTQLIARRVREAGVYCEILPWDADFERIRDFGAKGFILSSGPESTLETIGRITLEHQTLGEADARMLERLRQKKPPVIRVVPQFDTDVYDLNGLDRVNRFLLGDTPEQ